MRRPSTLARLAPLLFAASCAGAGVHATREPCAADVERFCEGVRYGGGRLIRCLAGHAEELTPACRERVSRLGGLSRGGQPPSEASHGGRLQLRLGRVTTIREQGGRVDWSRAHGRIAYDRPDENGYFQVHVMEPDGSNDECLTCDASPPLSSKHNGNPSWDPTGRYIVFQSQKQRVPDRLDSRCTPGAGTLNDLWIMTGDGARFWKIRDLPYGTSREAPGILHPHFSHDGSRLLWSERVGAGGLFGEWVLHIGNIDWGDSVRMDSVQTLTPGEWPCFYESHGWSADDSRILFSGNLRRGQPATGLDIYELVLKTGELVRLTESFVEWDEHAQYSPDGRRILWMSNLGLPLKLRPFELRTEFWVMDADGGNPRQLTRFNSPGSPEYRDEPFIVAADSSWSPDGRRLVALLIDADPGSAERDRGTIVIMELEEER